MGQAVGVERSIGVEQALGVWQAQRGVGQSARYTMQFQQDMERRL